MAARPWNSTPKGRMLIDSDLRQLEFLQKEIATLDQELALRGHATSKVKLLMTLPGVDVATAEAMLAAWGDFDPLCRRRPRRSLPGPRAFHASNRPTSATTARSPSGATATRGGCSFRPRSTSTSTPAPWATSSASS